MNKILFMKILFIDVQGNGLINTSFLRPPRLPSPQSLAVETIQMFLSKLASGELVCGLVEDQALICISFA